MTAGRSQSDHIKEAGMSTEFFRGTKRGTKKGTKVETLKAFFMPNKTALESMGYVSSPRRIYSYL